MQSSSVLVVPACILIIDDDENRVEVIRERLQNAFREHDEVLALGSIDWLSEGEHLVEQPPPRTVLVGRWRGWDPEKVRARLSDAYPDVPFYFIDDDMSDPGDALEIELAESNPINDRFRRIVRNISADGGSQAQRAGGGRAKPGWLFRGLAGESPAIQSVKNDISLVGAGDSTVLITGSNGTGKEIVARNIHFQSPRRLNPFVPVDCAVSAPERLERDLFGYEKGALEGGESACPGGLELADGGTLFLDNIGDMPLSMQFKLLRMLEERTFERVGGGTPRQVSVRLVAATHRDLNKLVAESGFREDLYHRLSVFPIHVPELRERIEDLAVLIEEIQRKRRENGAPCVRFTPRAFRALKEYSWPENLRELSELVDRLAVELPDREVDVEDLPPRYVAQPGTAGSESAPAPAPGTSRFHPGGLDLERYLADVERGLIRQALEETGGVPADAAALLTLQETALLEKMRRHDISLGSAATNESPQAPE